MINLWTANPNKSKTSTISLAGGINQSIDPLELDNGQTMASENVDSFIYPTVQVTDGHYLFSQVTGYISKLFTFKGIFYCGTEKGLYKMSGTSWVPVYEYADMNVDRNWHYAMFFDGSKLYFLDGTNTLRVYDGTTLSDVSGAPLSNFVTTHANRFYVANKTDNLLSYSGLRDASDWTSTNKYTGTGKITVETPDGETPTGLTTFGNHVILFKRYTMHKLFGEDSTNFNMTQPYGVGCISSRTIVPTRDSLFWLGVDGFYDYMGGAAPTKISDPIKQYISQINMPYAHRCCAGTDGRFVYLSLVTGSSTYPNVTLKYDTKGGQWWPMSFVATAFFLDGQVMSFGTADGKIMKIGNLDFAGKPIPWFIETKPYGDDDESVRKTINKITVVADLDFGSTINVSYAGGTEGDNWNVVFSSGVTNGKTQSIRIPIVVMTPETWFRVRIFGTGKVRIQRIIREVTRRGA